jgi:hypothetical protein
LTIARAAVPLETELLLLILMLLVVVLVLPSLSLLVYLGRRGPGRLARCGNRVGEGLPPPQARTPGHGLRTLRPLTTLLRITAGKAGSVAGNFEKFLVGQDGRVVRRFRSKTVPEGRG